MDNSELKSKTTDELISLQFKISEIIDARKQETKKQVFKIGMKGAAATYFKNFDKAVEQLIEEVSDESVVVEFGNALYIEPILISESDFNSRPDKWYDVL